ncbi:MAG: hypothetical protein K1060chlam4_00847 [Candidatus Anoxychlamydiales bacterium]|nr:hypothetical protein [Candidatus Anoxychlamydiales bacterium]
MTTICESLSSRLYDMMDMITPQNKKETAAAVLTCATSIFSKEAFLVGTVGYLGYKWITTDTKDPNEVYEIYSPIKGRQLTHLENEEIKSLKTKYRDSFLGISFVEDRDSHESKPIFIIKKQNSDKQLQFFAMDLESKKQLGFAIVQPFSSNDEVNKHWLNMPPKELLGYDKEKMDVSKVILEQVTNQVHDKYKNVGVVLLKAILQHSAPNQRIILDSVRNTQPYYYKLGFRTVNQNRMNAIFARMARSKTIRNKDNGSIYMFLPESGQKQWIEEIRLNPISS